MKKEKLFVVLTILILLLIDQISKIVFSNYINDLIIVPNFLKFTYIKNFGAAFGILQGKRLFFIIVTIIVVCYLIYELNKAKDKIYISSLMLIISGIIGNFIDRLFLGYVRDFISFTIFNPIFNIADSFIVIGVILFIINMFVGDRNENR